LTPTERVITFRPDEDLIEAMERLRKDEGVPFSQQIRRALREWLTAKGVMKTERPRVSPRRRS
jgi:hypothetical protein